MSTYSHSNVYSNEHEAAQCQGKCLTTNQTCILNCNQSESCQVECARQLSSCSAACPCFANCPNGCVDCDNPACQPCSVPGENPEYIGCESNLKDIYLRCLNSCQPSQSDCPNQCNQDYNDELAKCPCQDDCPNGCPCPHYHCQGADATTTTGKDDSIRPPYPVPMF